MEMSQHPAAASAEWWRQAVVYQIYPRSFADSDGDGLGDLRGILSRVPYLASLGIDAVWLSPFYPSGLADGGYDVDDYRDVNPQLGTLADFDEMTASLHGCGIKVIVDIVPNHTSNRHAWFREALAGPKGSRARDRYIFRDGQGPDGAQPPSDWASVFGGPAWTRVPDGQWYLHLFAAEQPDLNWANREVRDDFLTTLRFWSDRGVDGFRVDVAHGLAKNLAEPLEPLAVDADLADSPIPPSCGPAVRIRAATDAGSRCPGRLTARRSGSAPVLLTCRSRPGSARSASRRRRTIRPRPWLSTGRRSAGAASCRPQRTWSGCRAPTGRCCTSAAPAAGDR
jgi:Alpha amylase, catalytic domain